MPEAWRIVKEKHAASAFSGEGAAKTGGRWNSRGVPVVYASATKALAALETLVHLNPPVPFQYSPFPPPIRRGAGRESSAEPPDHRLAGRTAAAVHQSGRR